MHGIAGLALVVGRRLDRQSGRRSRWRRRRASGAGDERADVVAVAAAGRRAPALDEPALDEPLEDALHLALAAAYAIRERVDVRLRRPMGALVAPKAQEQRELERVELRAVSAQQPARHRLPRLTAGPLVHLRRLRRDEPVAGPELVLLARLAAELPGAAVEQVVEVVDGVRRAAAHVPGPLRAARKLLRPGLRHRSGLPRWGIGGALALRAGTGTSRADEPPRRPQQDVPAR